MKESSSKKLITQWIILGAVIGSIIGVLGVLGVIPGDKLLDMAGQAFWGGIGLIVLIIDALCVWALIRPFMSYGIERKGKAITGKISDIETIVRPDQIGVGEWMQKCRFVLSVTYEVEGVVYTKKFDPTCLTSRQELYPLVLEKDSDIPLKYRRKNPRKVIIDNETITKGICEEQKTNRKAMIIVPLALTLTYVFLLLALWK